MKPITLHGFSGIIIVILAVGSSMLAGGNSQQNVPSQPPPKKGLSLEALQQLGGFMGGGGMPSAQAPSAGAPAGAQQGTGQAQMQGGAGLPNLQEMLSQMMASFMSQGMKFSGTGNSNVSVRVSSKGSNSQAVSSQQNMSVGMSSGSAPPNTSSTNTGSNSSGQQMNGYMAIPFVANNTPSQMGM